MFPEKYSMVVMAVLQLVIGSIFFLWFARDRKPLVDDGGVAKAGTRNFEVLRRGEKLTAILNPQYFSRWAGLMYAGGFYFVAPVLIWRYGILKTLFLIVIPIGVGVGISQFVGDMIGVSLGFLASLIMRGWIGVFVASRDLLYYRNTLVRRGWVSVGFEVAKNKELAVSQFRSS
jgi:hypothetical protein